MLLKNTTYAKKLHQMVSFCGILAQELLQKRLDTKGYRQSKTTPGYWTHDWRPISFTLVMDDFGVKYVRREHAEHLFAAIEEHYDQASCDWEGS
ncbi:hypothetical protein ACHAXR_000443 [Thalassiosira sp. AJA248-18]